MAFDWNLTWMLFPIAGTLLLILTIKSFRIRLKDSRHLILTVICAFTFLISMLFMAYYLFIAPDLTTARFSQKIGTMALLITFIAGYFYYEGFISSTPPTARLTVMAGTFVLLLGINITNILDQFKDPNASALVFTFTFAYGVGFHLFGIRVLRRVKTMWD